MANFPEYKDTKPAILIKRALDIIIEPGAIFEVRIPKTRSGTISGYFNDTAIAAGLIAKENGKWQGVYVMPNPVAPALLARSSNQFEFGSHTTTSDAEIERRRWFLVDLDPKRPAGISSTEYELEQSILRAETINDWLQSLGWPEPLLASSGNGAHLMYRVDEPNDEDTRALFENATKMLSAIFTDDDIVVDTTSWNASRIWKTYGTIAAKGSDTEERPHRVGQILRLPKEFQCVPRGLLENVARPMLQARAEEFKDMTGEFIQDMQKWLTDRGVSVVGSPRPLFGSEGQKWSLAHCPFNHQHTSAIVGLVNNRPVFRCLHNSCSAFRWKDFREKIDPNFKDPDEVYRRLLEWIQSGAEDIDEELIQTACRTGNKLDGMLKRLKKEGGDRYRFGILEDRIKEAKRKFVAETIGENHEKGNVVGLIARTKVMQAEGIVPPFWTCDFDHRIRVGDYGDIHAPKLAEIDEVNLLVRFHGLGDSWVKQTHCGQVIRHIANEYHINPLRNYLKGLRWDGVKRLDDWLVQYMGTKDGVYTRAIGRKWLISAVARGMEPGCQADHMLIFEGRQGIGKSQALRILGGEFYVEFSRAISGTGTNHKDMVAAMSGKLILEMSELATIKKADIESLKAILTTTTDEVRLSYERDSKPYPRTAVFAGTTNEVGQAYIADISGARRFWPTHVGECGPVLIERLREDRDQLWAEAVEAYEAGEDWYKVPVEEVAAEQEERQLSTEITDPWYGAVREALTKPDCYTNEVFKVVDNYERGQLTTGFTVRLTSVNTLLQQVLSVDIDRQSQMDLARIRTILRVMQFKKTRPSGGWYGGTYAYELKQDAMPHLWPAIDAARRAAKLGEFQASDLAGD